MEGVEGQGIKGSVSGGCRVLWFDWKDGGQMRGGSGQGCFYHEALDGGEK